MIVEHYTQLYLFGGGLYFTRLFYFYVVDSSFASQLHRLLREPREEMYPIEKMVILQNNSKR